MKHSLIIDHILTENYHDNALVSEYETVSSEKIKLKRLDRISENSSFTLVKQNEHQWCKFFILTKKRGCLIAAKKGH